MASNAPQKVPRARSDRPRRNGEKMYRRWAGGVLGQGDERSAEGEGDVARSYLYEGNLEVGGERWRKAAAGDSVGRGAAQRGAAGRGGALLLQTAMTKLSSKLRWLSDGSVLLLSVRDEQFVGKTGQLCAALGDDTFEVVFNNFSLKQLLAAVLQYPTDLPNEGRFMRKSGDREPALFANLFTHEFEDWNSMHVRAAVVTTVAVTVAAARQGRDPRATASIHGIVARWRSCMVDRA